MDGRSEFRRLHESGCFVIPNPWDRGSARFLAGLGFKALATTSAGFAFSRGLPDTPTALSLPAVLEHVRDIVESVAVPVNADFQAGYSNDAQGVFEHVGRCIQTGCAGISIEDASADERAPLFERSVALERVKAARRAIDASGADVILTARCEAFLVGSPKAEFEVIERLEAFAAAGADCLFAPGVRDLRLVRELVEKLAPLPLNVLVSSPSPEFTVPRLADLGVRRVSVGSALARVAWGAFMRAAKSIAATGSFEVFGEAASFAELNSVFLEQK